MQVAQNVPTIVLKKQIKVVFFLRGVKKDQNDKNRSNAYLIVIENRPRGNQFFEKKNLKNKTKNIF